MNFHVESSVENEQNLYCTVLYIRYSEVDDCLREGEQIVMRQREEVHVSSLFVIMTYLSIIIITITCSGPILSIVQNITTTAFNDDDDDVDEIKIKHMTDDDDVLRFS